MERVERHASGPTGVSSFDESLNWSPVPGASDPPPVEDYTPPRRIPSADADGSARAGSPGDVDDTAPDSVAAHRIHPPPPSAAIAVRGRSRASGPSTAPSRPQASRAGVTGDPAANDRPEREAALAAMVEHLMRLFVRGSFGCGLDAHTSDLAEHRRTMEAEGLVCEDLEPLAPRELDDVIVPDALRGGPLPEISGPSARRRPEHQPSFLRTYVTGLPPHVPNEDPLRQRKPQICLHQEVTNRAPAATRGFGVHQTGDFDALNGWLRHLVDLKLSLRLWLAGPLVSSLSGNQHLHRETNGVNIESRIDQMVTVPLGQCVTDEGVTINVFAVLPHHPRAGSKSPYLDIDEARFWCDSVLLPALTATMASRSRGMVLPQSYDHLRGMQDVGMSTTRARPSAESNDVRTRHLYSVCTVPPEYFKTFWDEVVRRAPENPSFREVGLHYEAKGLKEALGKDSIREAVPAFHDFSSKCFDLVGSPEMIVDLGSEWMTDGRTAHTLVWRSCCVRRELIRVFGAKPNDPARPNVEHELFNVAGLRDVTNATAYPNPRSQSSLGGLSKLMVYAKYKDQAQRFHFFPLDSTLQARDPRALHPILDMALSERALEGARAAAHNVAPRARVHELFERGCDTLAMSYGSGAAPQHLAMRLECRITLRLLDAFRQALSELGPADRAEGPPHTTPTAPPHSWCVQTERLNSVSFHHSNRWVLLFRVGEALSRRSHTLESVQFKTCALTMAILSAAAHNYERKPHVWRRRFTRNDKEGNQCAQRGIGIGHNITRYGYAFADPVMDFGECVFKRSVQKMCGFNNRAYLRGIRRRVTQVQRLERSDTWLLRIRGWYKRMTGSDAEAVTRARKMMLRLLRYVCIEQYRIDTISHVVSDSKDRRAVARWTDAQIRLCPQHVGEMLGEFPALRGGVPGTRGHAAGNRDIVEWFELH